MRVVESGLFSRALDLHKLAAAGHHNVHVDLGPDILKIIEVKTNLPIHDSGTDRGDAVV